MERRSRSRCLHCREFYIPDYRNRGRQRHCSKAECRGASKALSQRRWNARAENKNYFRGAENVRRVKEWRARHPGYWRRGKASGGDALQEDCSKQVIEPQSVAPKRPLDALQDLCLLHPAVIVGLISTMTGSALQEDIARSARYFFARGHDILGAVPDVALIASHEDKTHPLPRTTAARAAPV